MITGSWVRERRFDVWHLLPRRIRSLHTLVLLAVIAAIGWLGWTWYRSSSFVKVEHVTVTGVSGPDAVQIRGALKRSALTMTTLDMQIDKLEQAVSGYAVVRALTVSTRGGHSVTIAVNEQVPVATVNIGGGSEVVDGNGELLPNTTIPHGALPSVPVKTAPTADHVTAAGARAAITVLATAPYSLLSHVASATSNATHGVVVRLRNGPQVYFGPSDDLHAKWAATTAVLRDKGSQGAAYIDVSDPQRPAAGVAVKPSQAVALGLVSPSPATTSASGSSTP